MEINIQELTENKKDNNLKKKHQSYNRRFLNYCEAFGVDPQKYMQEYYHDIVINSDEYKKLEAENQRLKNELDKQIKDNRKLIKTLKVYANTEPYVLKEDDWGKQVLDIRKIAQDILKEVEEE